MTFLHGKSGRRAWLRRRLPAFPVELKVLHYLSDCAEAMKGLASLTEEDTEEIFLHVRRSYSLVADMPGLRRSQRVRVFYYLCDHLVLPSDACLSLARLYIAFVREEVETASVLAKDRIEAIMRRRSPQ